MEDTNKKKSIDKRTWHHFESHAKECKELFHKNHKNLPKDKTGGLLGRPGKRETEVDKWEETPVLKAKLDDVADHFLELAKLAEELAGDFKKLPKIE